MKRFLGDKTAQIRHSASPGEEWTGPYTICGDAEVDHRQGYYALTPDGKELLKPLLRLTCVDLTPGDSEDGSFQMVVSKAGQPPLEAGEKIVSLEPDNVHTITSAAAQRENQDDD
jgi:DNA-binding PadR family transcriptional regulator